MRLGITPLSRFTSHHHHLPPPLLNLVCWIYETQTGVGTGFSTLSEQQRQHRCQQRHNQDHKR